MPGFVPDASEFWPDHPGQPRIRRRRDRHPRAGEKKFGAPDEVRTGAPSLGSNELREILGIIIILIGTNSFPDI
jgi:hypothetical protein